MASSLKIFEAWSDPKDDSIQLSDAEHTDESKENNTLSKNAKLLYSIAAATLEEASAIHHLRMGWEPYRPNGKAQPCPNKCGSMYYPESSGECPVCGEV